MGFSGMAIISPQGYGGWLYNWGFKFLPNQGRHNACRRPLIYYAPVHNQVPDRYQDLEGDGLWNVWFSILHVECDQLGFKGVYGPKGTASKAFHCIGHVLTTSRVDMVVGVWAKSSMVL